MLIENESRIYATPAVKGLNTESLTLLWLHAGVASAFAETPREARQPVYNRHQHGDQC